METFKYKVSLCAMYRDEAKYLAEWLEYYLMLGVEHFYLYNNLSTDDHLEVLKPYREKGLVTYHEYNVDISQKHFSNTLADPDYPYIHCVQYYKNQSRWIGFLDLDEFIVIYSGQNLPDLMVQYEEFDGLAIHWLCFGSSSHYLEPDGLVLENYTLRPIKTHPHNTVVKSIINPRHLKEWNNVHRPIMQGIIVREDKSLCPLHHDPNILLDKVAVFHYRRKSKWYNVYRKMGRGIQAKTLKTSTLNAHLNQPNTFVQFHYGDSSLWEQTNTLAWNVIQDLTMQKFVPELKKRLNIHTPTKHQIIDYQHYIDHQPGILDYINTNLKAFKNQLLSLIHHHWLIFNDATKDVKLVNVSDIVSNKVIDEKDKFREWLVNLSNQMIQEETQALIQLVPSVREIVHFPKPVEDIVVHDAIIQKYLLDYGISIPANFNVQVYVGNGTTNNKYQVIQHWLEVGRYQGRKCC